MTTITAAIATTNPALRASLREPSSKSFKASARGLMAAVDWLADQRQTLIASQGNLSHPRASLTLDGTTISGFDLDCLIADVAAIDDEYLGRSSRTSEAAKVLAAFTSYNRAA